MADDAAGRAVVTRQCLVCGDDFLLSSAEQEWLSLQGYCWPKRCLACRRARRVATTALPEDLARRLGR